MTAKNSIRNGFTIKKAITSAITRVLKSAMTTSKINSFVNNYKKRIDRVTKKLWNTMQVLGLHQITRISHQPSFPHLVVMWNITYQGARDLVLGHVRDANLCPILDPTRTTTNEVALQLNGSILADKRLLGQAMVHTDWSASKAQGSIKTQEHEPNTSTRYIHRRASNRTTSTRQ